jgi:hypothetical protein
MVGISDGTSNTLLFGERFHFDRNFDNNVSRIASQNKLYRWAAWAYCGGYHGAGHVLGSSRVPLNYIPAAGNSLAEADKKLSGFSSGHINGVNFCVADGSVRFLDNSIPLQTLQGLTTRAAGDIAEFR